MVRAYNRPTMRRWILSILLLVLPFQAVWAVTTPYCGHEAGGAVAHVGHHEHQHGGRADVDKSVPLAAVDDMDCGSCHLNAPATMPAALEVFELRLAAEPLDSADPLYVSCTPSGPERPDISRSLAAVRFGGGGAWASLLT